MRSPSGRRYDRKSATSSCGEPRAIRCSSRSFFAWRARRASTPCPRHSTRLPPARSIRCRTRRGASFAAPGAGRHAASAYAPAEAATHLERAITAARRLGDVPSEEIAELLVELGEALVTLGVFDKADDAYRRAAAALRHDPIEHARVLER